MAEKTKKEGKENESGKDEDMLAERTEYLSCGAHIGMKTCTKYMKNFIYKIRENGLAVFNIKKVDDRARAAANFLSRFDKVLIVSRKRNGYVPIEKFAEAIGGKAISGRFPPGMLTNPSFDKFYEPEAVFVVDPLVDSQVVNEAKKKRIPIVALCDTFNYGSDVDLLIPLNNNGRKSLAFIFWLLAREISKKRGKIKSNEDFTYSLNDFMGDKAA